MKNVTLQLFEYLAAAQNSNLSVDYNLNKYPAYWFLDEILFFRNNKIEKLNDGRTCITLYKPSFKEIKVDVSDRLTKILKLTQQTDIEDDIGLLAPHELEIMLNLERDTLTSKLMDKTKNSIIVNEWQQLLLDVDSARITMDQALNQATVLTTVIQGFFQEYQAWFVKMKQKRLDKIQRVKAQEVYDYLMRFNHNMPACNKLKLGVGILNIPGEKQIYHPLLTVGVEVFADPLAGICELILKEEKLEIDHILEHILFCDLEAAGQIKTQINSLNIGLFDDEIIASVLQKIINHVHPDGKYLTSQAVDESEEITIPEVMHRTVLFIREDKEDSGTRKVKSIINHLSAGNEYSDALGSIVNPNHEASGSVKGEYTINEYEREIIPCTDSFGDDVLELLEKFQAVAVTVTHKADEAKILAVAKLVTQFVAMGKRILITSVAPAQLGMLKDELPAYLKTFSNDLPVYRTEYSKIKNDLNHLLNKLVSFETASAKMIDIGEEITKIKTELTAITNEFVKYRELGSKKVQWKGKYYYPHELAQFISKLGGLDTLAGDSIPQNVAIDAEDAMMKKMWDLRPYFTAENMELLNFDFIDVSEIKAYPEYERLLMLEEGFKELLQTENKLTLPDGEQMDADFAQHLIDKLPVIMNGISSIEAPFANRLFKRIIGHVQNHNMLLYVMNEINDGIRRLEFFSGTNEEREEIISLLNAQLELSVLDLPVLPEYGHRQLVGFYADKKNELEALLRVSHMILKFNDESQKIAPQFKGIKDTSLVKLQALYNTAALCISEIELEKSWLKVKDHFLKEYEILLHKEHIHPSCTQVYDALVRDKLNGFKESIEQIEELMRRRENFVTFGDFIDEIGQIMPFFTKAVMSEESSNEANFPSFKEAFDQGKLNNLFDELQAYEFEEFINKIEQRNLRLVNLQLELTELQSFKKQQTIEPLRIKETIKLLEKDRVSNDEVALNLIKIFPVQFLPQNANDAIKNYDPTLFDLVIHLDASRSNIMSLSELTHAHKVVVFGNDDELQDNVLTIKNEDSQKLVNRFGQTMHRFGISYFDESLFTLITDSAAWDSRLDLENDISKEKLVVHHANVKAGVKKCDTLTKSEIFDALIQMGYTVKCKVEAMDCVLDFVIVKDESVFALNVVGDVQLSRDEILAQIETESQLRSLGLNLHIVHATCYHLNPRKTLEELCNQLANAKITP